MNNARIKKNIEQLIARASFSLRSDVLHALERAYRREKNKKAKKALEWIIENSRIAKKEGVSLSLKARDMIKESLELYEDLHWEEQATQRDKTFSSKKALSHREIWDE